MSSWTRISDGNTRLYVNQSGDIIAITQPNGYDYWNIYDSTGRVVEGHSLGPFSAIESALRRIEREVDLS